MDVLVVGGGGREHALVWALQRSPSVDRIYCAPGNAGIARHAECWDIKPGDLQALAHRADAHAVDLAVIGPEAPLAAGIAEVFESVSISCFGPGQQAAIIEGSKAFAKSFMDRNGIPTAPFRVFGDARSAEAFAGSPDWGFPVVVKADGLAAGKGVMICDDAASAIAAVRACMTEGAFGAAGRSVVIEQCLRGAEVSLMALTDGTRVLPLVPAQDHKQAFDGDAGPNTGGMGAFAPATGVLDATATAELVERILVPTVAALADEDRPFSGLIYAGLMLTDDGPSVLEYNCRFGDPEAQAIIPLLNEDFGELLAAIADGDAPSRLNWHERNAACVVLASAGYPGSYRHGDEISGLDTVAGRDDVVLFHAGTNADGDRVLTAGGRVLGVTGLGASLQDALDNAYSAINSIHFEGMHYRTDIGRRGS